MPKIIEGFADRLMVPAGKRDVLVFDEGHRDAVPGFGIRKFQSGKSYYFIKYNVGPRQRRQSLGSVTPGNLKSMRLLASEIKARARLGQDVIADRQAAASLSVNPSVGQIVSKFLGEKRTEMRRRSYAELERHIVKDWRTLHSRAISSVTRADVIEVVNEIANRRGKTAADRAKTSLSTFYAWSIDRGICAVNPTTGIKPRARKSQRTRVLSEEELIEVWKACDDDSYGRVVRLLILTGQRRTEIADLTWSEIDFDSEQINLPGDRTRNALPHVVPLAGQALAILRHAKPMADGEFVFGNRGSAGFRGWSKAKRRLDARISLDRQRHNRSPMPSWVLHDLRRSFVTLMNEHGFAQPHVVECAVNHISGFRAGVAGTYNKAAYLRERREAFMQWDGHVARLLFAESEYA